MLEANGAFCHHISNAINGSIFSTHKCRFNSWFRLSTTKKTEKKPNMKTFEFWKYLTFRNETLQFTFLFNLKTFPRSQESLTHQV